MGIPILFGNSRGVHEASIALAIVEEVSDRTADAGIEKITAVYLRIGALSSVVPEALSFAWELAVDGTLASGSQLHIEHVPLTIACTPCGCLWHCERARDIGKDDACIGRDW